MTITGGRPRNASLANAGLDIDGAAHLEVRGYNWRSVLGGGNSRSVRAASISD